MCCVDVKNKLDLLKFYLLAISFLLLSGCGGGGSGGTSVSTPTNPTTQEPNPTTQEPTGSAVLASTLELLDPTPGLGNNFGDTVIVLANGNIVISDSRDSSVAFRSGAVHLYSAGTQVPISSFYGDTENDEIGTGGIIALANNNFVVVSDIDDVAGILNAGSVRLFDGVTGAEIATLAGDFASARLGRKGVMALANSNFIIDSQLNNGDSFFGARVAPLTLVDGNNGAQIAAIEGTDSSDFNFLRGRGANDITVTVLANSHFVVAEGGLRRFPDGLVRLFSGTTGAQIGTSLSLRDRDLEEDVDDVIRGGALSTIGAITALSNSNFVIAPSVDLNTRLNGVRLRVDVNSARLVNGTSGAQITTLAGNVDGGALASFGSITALANNNFVVAAVDNSFADGPDLPSNDVAGGSVRLFNGDSGAQIGNTPLLSNFMSNVGVNALANNNFVVNTTQLRDINGNNGNSVDSIGEIRTGSVALFNGDSGAQIGTTLLASDSDNVVFRIASLANSNFVIDLSLRGDTVVQMARSRLVFQRQLIDGTSGTQIATLANDVDDVFGDDVFVGVGATTTALANSNFANVSVTSSEVALFDGGSSARIGGDIIDLEGVVDGGLGIVSLLIAVTVDGDSYIASYDGDSNIDSGFGRVFLFTP